MVGEGLRGPRPRRGDRVRGAAAPGCLSASGMGPVGPLRAHSGGPRLPQCLGERRLGVGKALVAVEGSRGGGGASGNAGSRSGGVVSG